MLIHSSPLWIILLVVLVMLIVGALPSWPRSRDWGSFPSGMRLVVLVILLLILLLLL